MSNNKHKFLYGLYYEFTSPGTHQIVIQTGALTKTIELVAN